MSQFKEVTLVCEDSVDGIMTAIYDGWVLMLEGKKVNIYPGDDYSYELFHEYVHCKTNLKKAESVAESIKEKISAYAYEEVFRSCMHYDKNRGNVVLEFLKVGFRAGASTTKMLGEPRVINLMELARKVGNEAHLFKEVVRFSEIGEKILFSKIEPKCDVLLLIEHHFSERYPEENWIIYDEGRKKGIIHKYKSETMMVSGEQLEEAVSKISIKDDYDELWKVFFEAIGIKERFNPRCQMNLLPKWYRKNMTEFN